MCPVGTCIGKVGLSHTTEYDQAGKSYTESNTFPFKIDFEPMDIKNFKETFSSIDDFFGQFRDIPINSKIYSIRTFESPEDETGSIIGNMRTTGKCDYSQYGDAKLAFRHQRIEEDMTLKPEWKEAYQKDCFCNPSSEDTDVSNCYDDSGFMSEFKS